MSELFPVEFPRPTAIYLTLYVVTLALHVVFMSYVVVGAALVATRWGSRGTCPSVRLVVDWLPFALSAAITAGVAPLLFVQVLYQERFYTANLLLFGKWLAVLPLLVIGFYLLYVAKGAGAGGGAGEPSAPVSRRWRPSGRVAITIAWVSFVGVAFLWTQNHQISIAHDAWPAIYADGGSLRVTAASTWRLLVWLIGAVPVFAAVHLLQLDHPPRRWLSITVLAGWLAAAGAVFGFATISPPEVRAVMHGALAGPYAGVAIVAALVNATAWAGLLGRGRDGTDGDRVERAWSTTIFGSAVVVVVAATVVREAVRLAAFDVRPLYPAHATALEQGGAVVFGVFLVVNAAVVGWCIRVARRSRRAGRVSPLS